MTAVVLLTWQQFCHWSCLETEIHSYQGASTPGNLMMRVKKVWEPCMFQAGSSAHSKGLKMRIFCFLTESDWGQENFHGNNTMGVIWFLL